MSSKTFFITGANSGLWIWRSPPPQWKPVTPSSGTVRSEGSRDALVKTLPELRPVLCDVTDFDRIP